MPSVTIRNRAGEAVGQRELPATVFGANIRTDLVHAAVVAQLAARRLGTAQAKSRGQVAGGGRKPYRQKGTGRARQGSTRSPQWRGGGVAFPPLPRDYSQRLPRKVRRAALFAAWSDQVASEQLLVIDDFGLDELKTKSAAAALRALLQPVADQVAAAVEPPAAAGEDEPPARRKRVRHRALVLLAPTEAALQRAFGNIAELEFGYAEKVTVLFTVQLGTAPYASVYDLVLADAVVLTQAALERVEAEFAAAEESVDA
ncbi:MAG: 50S ribosomal protein L4 [Fimbriimonadaceae bacterium]|nr:50S ribosomal protein L4 [Fimbriimonadaceae bacterium]